MGCHDSVMKATNYQMLEIKAKKTGLQYRHYIQVEFHCLEKHHLAGKILLPVYRPRKENFSIPAS